MEREVDIDLRWCEGGIPIPPSPPPPTPPFSAIDFLLVNVTLLLVDVPPGAAVDISPIGKVDELQIHRRISTRIENRTKKKIEAQTSQLFQNQVKASIVKGSGVIAAYQWRLNEQRIGLWRIFRVDK